MTALRWAAGSRPDVDHPNSWAHRTCYARLAPGLASQAHAMTRDSGLGALPATQHSPCRSRSSSGVVAHHSMLGMSGHSDSRPLFDSPCLTLRLDPLLHVGLCAGIRLDGRAAATRPC